MATRGLLTALLTVFCAALALATPAWASVSATYAPNGAPSSGSYLVSVTNSEAQKTEGVTVIDTNGGVVAGSVAPTNCTYGQPIPNTIGCPQIAAGATLQVCYTGPAPQGVSIFYAGAPTVSLTPASTVPACPVPGFVLPAGGGGGGETGSPSPGGADFSLGKVKNNPDKGTAALVVQVPEAGTVKISGKGVKGATAHAKQAGPITLTVKAGGKAASALVKTGKVSIKVSVAFTPAGGSASTQSKTVKLIKKLAK